MYIVVPQGTRTAILVDPVRLDRGVYQLLVGQGLTVETVLVTHPEQYMYRGLRTLEKVFDYELVSGTRGLPAPRSRVLKAEQTIECSGATIRAIPVLPHSRESFVFVMESLVFTGSIIHAGTLGETENAFAEALLVATVKDFLFPLRDDTLVLPSVGPPTTLEAERTLSPYYHEE
jgi:glyoxylase-like metal-dependent hydrolase (beta-lactamase superfamily II)